ncbi:hypothetical protein Mal4_35740 [Maioricimonas rarisocia]|uniref:Uncharacterized protein n=1 Tax=Maioricimonas rarisocia TaxID=2528026 RepID=A0A517Z9S4_9PLAN|nr:hypothetical protein [Maioricimonas rarisocia]QDU39237.1 hypothetical protein Mal4_35740 [Maioricimonas rarisocia]
MANLTNPRLIWIKGVLFLLLGLLASGILIARMTDFSTVALLAIAIWAFCRAYYFAFYVIERYVDPEYRFAGLIDFVRYAVLGRHSDRQDRATSDPTGP